MGSCGDLDVEGLAVVTEGGISHFFSEHRAWIGGCLTARAQARAPTGLEGWRADGWR
jgi:hypothetical protein